MRRLRFSAVAARQSAAILPSSRDDGGTPPKCHLAPNPARTIALVAVLLVVALVGRITAADTTSPLTPPAADSPEAALKQRAAAIAKQAFSELSSNLLAAIGRSGLNDALPYCSDKAIPITKGVAAKNGVGLSRISHKARNPANRASAAERQLLSRFQQDVKGKRALVPIVVTNASATVSVYVPIVIPNPLCLSCHGTPGVELSEETHTTIRRLYPEDQATGFALGDLRGAWRVEFPAKPAAQ